MCFFFVDRRSGSSPPQVRTNSLHTYIYIYTVVVYIWEVGGFFLTFQQIYLINIKQGGTVVQVSVILILLFFTVITVARHITTTTAEVV